MSDMNSCSGDCSCCGSDCETNAGGATVTLNLDDGSVVECAVLTIYHAGDHEYVALLPLNEQGENETGEVFLYRFINSDGEPTLENIESDEEYEIASDGFDQWLDDHEFDDLVYEDTGSEEA